jgi:hypothetical protein
MSREGEAISLCVHTETAASSIHDSVAGPRIVPDPRLVLALEFRDDYQRLLRALGSATSPPLRDLRSCSK